jgi:hypothetical protein
VSPQRGGGLLDHHPSWRTAKQRDVTGLDVSPLHGGIFDPRRPRQRLGAAARAGATAQEDGETQQDAQHG